MKNTLSRKRRNEGDIIKELLFDILDTLQPHEILKLSLNNNDVYVCRQDAYLPLAVGSLRYEPEMEQENYFYGSIHTQDYVKTHKFIINDMEFVIDSEITYIKYAEDHIHLIVQGIDMIQEHFIPYTAINLISKLNTGCYNRNCNSYTREYNKIQYELNKGD